MDAPLYRTPPGEISPSAAQTLGDALRAYQAGDLPRTAAALALIDARSWALIRERLGLLTHFADSSATAFPPVGALR
jgi:hypothetical protein